MSVSVCVCVRTRMQSQMPTNAAQLKTITSVCYGSVWTKEVYVASYNKLKLQYFAVTSDILIQTSEEFYFIF